MKCTSCRRETPEIVRFSCPKCKKEIVRCQKCRSLSIDYKCDCGYIGP